MTPPDPEPRVVLLAAIIKWAFVVPAMALALATALNVAHASAGNDGLTIVVIVYVLFALIFSLEATK